MAQMTLKEQAEAIKRTAAELGLEQNYLFITTFERYEVQLSILDQFKESMDKDGMIVSKEYVKGRGNLYTRAPRSQALTVQQIAQIRPSRRLCAS